MEAENLFETLAEVKAKALVDAPADTLEELEAATLIDRMAEVKAKPPLDSLVDTLAEVEACALSVSVSISASVLTVNLD